MVRDDVVREADPLQQSVPPSAAGHLESALSARARVRVSVSVFDAAGRQVGTEILQEECTRLHHLLGVYCALSGRHRDAFMDQAR